MIFTLTGATGFVGQELVAALLKSHHHIRVLSRDPENARKCFNASVEVFPLDFDSIQSLKTAFSGSDCVIHLAGEGIANHRWTKRQKLKILNSRVQGTQAVVHALNTLGAKSPPTLVCASAIGIYGDRSEEILTETSSLGSGFLSEVCKAWEQQVQQVNKPVRAVSIRIGIVLGKNGGALKKMLPLFRLGLSGPIAQGTQWMSWIHIQDLIRLIEEIAQNDHYVGPVNAVAPHPVTNKIFTQCLSRVLHRPAFLPVPKFALKLAMGELSQLVLGSQRVLPQKALEQNFKFKFPELEKALSNFLTHP